MIKSTRTKCFVCKHNLSHLETYDGRVQDCCELNENKEYHTYRIKRCSNYEKKSKKLIRNIFVK